MRVLASFILRGQWQAVSVIVLTALLPLVNLLSGAALALVTLRKGAREGLISMLLATVLLGVLMAVRDGSALPVIGVLTLVWLPLWLLSITLRYTISLARTLQLALLLALLVLLGYTAYLGDTAAWGQQLFEQVLAPLWQRMQLLAEQQAALKQLLDVLAPLSLGLLVANGLALVLLSLLLGRWWQALLFYPGGFRTEFHELRLGRQLAIGTVLAFGSALVLEWPLLTHLTLLLITIYALQGIALVHGIVGKARLSRGWLVGFYVLLLFMLPELLLLLCLFGVIDAWADFRARIKPSTGVS